MKKSVLITCCICSLLWAGCTKKAKFLKGAAKITKDTVVVVTESHRHTIVETKKNRIYTFARDTINTIDLLKTTKIVSKTATHIYTIAITEKEGKEIKRDTVSIVILDDDADGVPNFEDECPKKKGSYANKGCPENSTPPARKNSISQALAKHTQGLLFPSGSPQISPGTYTQLNAIVKLLKRYPKVHLLIEGHTDNVGSTQKNKTLSLKRANFVQAYFVRQGIAAHRLKVAGKGSIVPITSNKTAVGRSKNRRIEVRLIK
ncbi:OmpA family protein [uncultured Microscilla sp.]|uniref:OmpA family protein n=1 Tax=uncultured Microscilla sp. TaxID=432653 RepID=UPI0026208266|nr:OmpA family protein [uncultured Microscilla sp.]